MRVRNRPSTLPEACWWWWCWTLVLLLLPLAQQPRGLAVAFMTATGPLTALPRVRIRPHRQATTWQSSSCSLSSPARTTTSSVRHLFFKSFPLEEPAPDATLRLDADSTTPSVYEGLSSGHITLPYTTTNITNSKSGATAPAVLTLRLMQERDIPAITDMCVQEYGKDGVSEQLSGATLLKNPAALGDWLDRLALRLLVDSTMRMKTASSHGPSERKDHAVIVACLSSSEIINNNNNNINNNNNHQTTATEQIIVGMIEISQQPVLPDRNPPPVPIPLLVKRFYCQLTHTPLQGWIANLLVTPAARGRGIAKLLVAAAEGVACRAWQCDSVHLHCDANAATGKIPQQLYLTMGYQPGGSTSSSTVDLSWMVSASSASSASSSTMLANLGSSIYFIDGVALLYLQKALIASSPSSSVGR